MKHEQHFIVGRFLSQNYVFVKQWEIARFREALLIRINGESGLQSYLQLAFYNRRFDVVKQTKIIIP